MGTKRIGLARVQALLQNLKRDLELGNTSLLNLKKLASGMGVIAPQTAKTEVGAGAFSPSTLVANTHYVVTGTITTTSVTLPAGEVGDVIWVEMISETAAALMVANTNTLAFTTPGASFEANSAVRWLANAASNGAAQVTKAIDAATADGSGDNILTLTGATAGGPGNGTWICFTKGATLWRVEGWAYGAGACTAVPNIAFS
jgi:hypothetical protein|tara:strand:+ start:2508 stop:3113 length:606 start_codon:yes stop_codon:yes gene_type:complete